MMNGGLADHIEEIKKLYLSDKIKKLGLKEWYRDWRKKNAK